MKELERLNLIDKLTNAYTTCHDCGLKYGVYSVGCSSVWDGKCDVCGENKKVTESRDYGYFMTGIRKLKKEQPSTIESPPKIQHDWEQDYRKQRKNRLADSITEYLEDEDATLTLYHDLQDILKEQIQYYSKEKNRAECILKMIHPGS